MKRRPPVGVFPVGAAGATGRRTRLLLVLLLLVPVIRVSAGCATAPSSFAIESPAGRPCIEMADISSYDWGTHTITLRRESAVRLARVVQPPREFTVTAGGETVYRGRFVSPFQSATVATVVIVLPPLGDEDLTEEQIRLELGYPSERYFEGADPRSDPRVRRALEQAGRLAEVEP